MFIEIGSHRREITDVCSTDAHQSKPHKDSGKT